MKKLLIGLLAILLLFQVGCETEMKKAEAGEKSKLPEKMPVDTEMVYSSSGPGKNADIYIIKISSSKIIIEDLRENEADSKTYEAEISKADKVGLYTIFVNNKFDLVKSEENRMAETHSSSESLLISAGDINNRVSMGKEYKFSGGNAESRFLQVSAAMKKLANDYKPKAKIVKPDE